MKITFEHHELEDIFHSSLCNGLGQIEGYGLSLDYNQVKYSKVKQKLSQQNPHACICFEDTLMEMLREGCRIGFIDEEDGNEFYEITLENIYNRIPNSPIDTLISFIKQEDDADSADAIIQQVLFNETRFS